MGGFSHAPWGATSRGAQWCCVPSASWADWPELCVLRPETNLRPHELSGKGYYEVPGDSHNCRAWDHLGASEPRPIRAAFRGPAPPTSEEMLLSRAAGTAPPTLSLDTARYPCWPCGAGARPLGRKGCRWQRVQLTDDPSRLLGSRRHGKGTLSPVAGSERATGCGMEGTKGRGP